MADIDFEKAVIDADDEAVKKLFQKTDKTILVQALKASSPEASEKIFRNMSEIESEGIKTEMRNFGPIRIQEVELAQKKLVELLST
jgi:flagellar motor switch protein FliG